ncbi:MAG: methanol dehydrogenase [Cyanobacteria bacterium QS_8_64_29]|nr:MAG: methanol dehydrogenase [Cyanobacteria bacterium QS_8_64_29]
MRQWRPLLAAGLLALALVALPPPARAVDDPSLLPERQTPVIDLANFLPQVQEQSLAADLERFEAETGWKLRVLTQYSESPGRAVKPFWGLDERSILLVADARGGNLLAFNVGDAAYDRMPRTFWVELQTRYGNQYYVGEHGENDAIISALDAVRTCLRRDGGCEVVPGLPQEQWVLTLATSIVGGLVLGFAAVPRREGEVVAWQWPLIVSPLWLILFGAFGIGPVVTRTADWLPLFRNVLGFAGGILVAYLTPVVAQSLGSDEG